MAKQDEPIIPPPESCPPASVVIDGDITVDISDEALDDLATQICDCIETQTGELCECFTNAINLVVEAIENIPQPPVVLPIACQPCIAVDGVLDPYATVSIVDGVRTYYNLTGLLDAAQVEVLDPCDPRCNAPCPCEPPAVLDCCDHECSPEDFPAVAAIVKGLIGA